VIDVRIRSLISDQELQHKLGKIVTPSDYNLVLTGAARVRKPDGSLLCVYIPEAIPPSIAGDAYPVLHSLRHVVTDNRGLASGTPRVQRGTRKRVASGKVASAIIGAFDPSANHGYCRLTAWTGSHSNEMRQLLPMLEVVSAYFQEAVPERYAVQANYARRTDPAWRMGNTPFTTVTVNNTYPTGVHLDAGDLDSGFSTIVCLRRGQYRGGLLTFPRLRVAIDLHDRDLVLMDAHEWHGNTAIEGGCDAERISMVAYYRSGMAACGDYDTEHGKALDNVHKRSRHQGS
jgi:Oxygenase domain of the 2OGFeDO superfamily